MVMTNEEIVRDYRLSRNKKEQIRILADRNTTTQDAIREVLLDAGMEVPAKRKSRKKTVAWDKERARELLIEGKADREIAEEVGTTVAAVSAWRYRAGLSCNNTRKKPASQGKPPEQEVTTVFTTLPTPELETSAEDSPVIYRQIESILAALPEGMGEKARWAAGKLAAELFAEYLMIRLGLREDDENDDLKGCKL